MYQYIFKLYDFLSKILNKNLKKIYLNNGGIDVI